MTYFEMANFKTEICPANKKLIENIGSEDFCEEGMYVRELIEKADANAKKELKEKIENLRSLEGGKFTRGYNYALDDILELLSEDKGEKTK